VGQVHFLRFVVPSLTGEDSHEKLGLIWAADYYRDAGHFGYQDEQALDRVFDWFNTNLPCPDRLNRSTRPHRAAKAVSWFKPEAGSCIAKMTELRALLERYGLPTELLKTRRPGYVVYEDEYQVVAEPFRAERPVQARVRYGR